MSQMDRVIAGCLRRHGRHQQRSGYHIGVERAESARKEAGGAESPGRGPVAGRLGPLAAATDKLAGERLGGIAAAPAKSVDVKIVGYGSCRQEHDLNVRPERRP